MGILFSAVRKVIPLMLISLICVKSVYATGINLRPFSQFNETRQHKGDLWHNEWVDRLIVLKRGKIPEGKATRYGTGSLRFKKNGWPFLERALQPTGSSVNIHEVQSRVADTVLAIAGFFEELEKEGHVSDLFANTLSDFRQRFPKRIEGIAFAFNLCERHPYIIRFHGNYYIDFDLDLVKILSPEQRNVLLKVIFFYALNYPLEGTPQKALIRTFIFIESMPPEEQDLLRETLSNPYFHPDNEFLEFIRERELPQVPTPAERGTLQHQL